MTRLEKILDLNLTLQRYIGIDKLEDICALHFSELAPCNHNLLFDKDYDNILVQVPYTSFSDYGGSIVERSNSEAILYEFEVYDFVHPCEGGWGSSTVFIELGKLLTCPRGDFDLIISRIEALLSYPLLDEMLYGGMCLDAQDEAWENWVRHDFLKALEKKLDYDLDLNIESDDLRSLFEKVRERSNIYWEEESSGMWVDIEAVVENVLEEDINA
jgi:hypothetical protein